MATVLNEPGNLIPGRLAMMGKVQTQTFVMSPRVNVVMNGSLRRGKVPQAPTSYPTDFAQDLAQPTKTISGRVFDRNKNLVSGATVLLLRTSDNQYVAQMTTGSSGTYVFLRDAADPFTYYTVAYSLAGGTTQVHGTSDRGMVPA